MSSGWQWSQSGTLQSLLRVVRGHRRRQVEAQERRGARHGVAGEAAVGARDATAAESRHVRLRFHRHAQDDIDEAGRTNTLKHGLAFMLTIFNDHFSGPGGSIGPVCLCVWTITVE